MSWRKFVPIDPRILRVRFTINGKIKTINLGTDVDKHLAITAQGAKFASATQNETVIKICNLDRVTRDFLATEGTPFNRIRQVVRQKVEIFAGRISSGTARLFLGDITLVTLSQPPDIWTTIRAITSQYKKGDIVVSNEGALSNLSTISQKAADSLGLSLQNEADEKQISNYGYAGSATKQVEKIAELADVDAYIDDDKLVIKNKGQALSGGAKLISQPTGMVGMPEFTEVGTKVTYFFDIHSGVGQSIDVLSKFYPATNGQYNIYKLNFNLSNKDTPFYYIAETRRAEAIL
jgi:hypothetical protein